MSMQQASETAGFIDEAEVGRALVGRAPDPVRVREILAKADALRGLDAGDIAELAEIRDPGMADELCAAARRVKDAIYGRRLVIFAPMYVSNLCANECVYCAFRTRNREVVRRALTVEEVRRETEALVEQGQDRKSVV